jgi:uncharacterized OB-fold protein
MTTAVNAESAKATEDNAAADIRVAAERLTAAGQSQRVPARDPVNLPTTHTWLDAMGDANPIYTSVEAARAAGHPGLVAPPAMIQVWTMPGLRGRRGDDDPLTVMTGVLDAAGYPAVVATDCEQVYHRYLLDGESLSVSARLEGVVGPKRTALGEGWFVTTRSTWFVGEEPVAEMMFRILKYRPSAPSPAPTAAPAEPASYPTKDVLRPVISLDTEFFWAGTAVGELRIQRCSGCGALRHPPGPMCPNCGAEASGHVVVDGVGTIFSYVVHHHPKVPGRSTPYVVALVELTAGVRMLGEVVGVDPASVRVGDPLELVWQKVDDTLTLPAWRVRINK